MNLNSPFNLLVKVEKAMNNEKHEEALNTLNQIIDLYQTASDTIKKFGKEVLIVCLLKRVHLNFHKQKYDSVLTDVNLLIELGENISVDKNLFIMYQRATLELSLKQMIKQFQDISTNDDDEDIQSILHQLQLIDIKSIFSRNQTKSALPKRQKH